MFKSLLKAKEALLDVLFPPLCLNCQKYLERKNKYICDICLDSIEFNSALFCPVCRARLAENKRICHYDAGYFLAAAGNYHDPVLQNLIHYFKYKSFKNLAPILGEIIVKYIEICKLKIENFVIIPVPLHPKRERERGFNQAKLLADFLTEKFGLKLAEPLKRVKNTKPQAALKKIKDEKSREENVLSCFKIENSDCVAGENIILIDDVFTSGATMNEAVKTLKENGAKRIIALVIAKT